MGSAEPKLLSLSIVSAHAVALSLNLGGLDPPAPPAAASAVPQPPPAPPLLPQHTHPLLQRPLLAVAPMIDVTNRHFRMMIRCISELPVLWTEMTWDRAILYNTPDQPEHQLKKTELERSLESIIGFSPEEQPIVMQLGGCDPERLARAAKLAEERGYAEINLNCGCPAQTRGRSRNNYGARLMKEPEVVAAACAAMVAAVSIPVTVKCRLGVDERDSYDELQEFVRVVSAAGVTHFIVHARKAILGLDTVKNRSVPPLRHEWVFRLIADFPRLRFSINGGIKSLEEAKALLAQGVHGVMIGRRARDEPYMFARAGEVYGVEGTGPTRREVLRRYSAYAARAQAANWDEKTPAQDARALLTPLSGLFHGTRCGKRWSQALCAIMQDRAALGSCAVPELISRALEMAQMSDAVLDAAPDAPPAAPAGRARQAAAVEAAAAEEEDDERWDVCPAAAKAERARPAVAPRSDATGGAPPAPPSTPPPSPPSLIVPAAHACVLWLLRRRSPHVGIGLAAFAAVAAALVMVGSRRTSR